MIAKAPIERFVHGFDGNLNGGGLSVASCTDGRGAIFDGNSFAFFDTDDVSVAGDEFDVVRDFANELVVASFFEDKLLAGFGAVKGDSRREDGDLRHGEIGQNSEDGDKITDHGFRATI